MRLLRFYSEEDDADCCSRLTPAMEEALIPVRFALVDDGPLPEDEEEDLAVEAEMSWTAAVCTYVSLAAEKTLGPAPVNLMIKQATKVSKK